MEESDWYDKHYYNKTQIRPELWYEYAEKLLSKNNSTDVKTIVEIGCGTGVGLKYITENSMFTTSNLKVYGTDLSDNAINQARKNIPYGIFHKYIGGKLDIQDRSADLIILMEVFEHFDDPQFYLNEIKRILKPQGYLLLSFPNYLNFPWYVLRILAEKLNKPSWIMLQPTDKIYNYIGLKNLLKKNSLSLVESLGCVYFPPVLYKYEAQAITNFLNKTKLELFAFHPVMLFRYE